MFQIRANVRIRGLTCTLRSQQRPDWPAVSPAGRSLRSVGFRQAGGLTGDTANLAVKDSHAGRARCGITADWLSRASRISANFAESTATDIARGALSAWADNSDQSALAISATIEASAGIKNGWTIRL